MGTTDGLTRSAADSKASLSWAATERPGEALLCANPGVTPLGSSRDASRTCGPSTTPSTNNDTHAATTPTRLEIIDRDISLSFRGVYAAAIPQPSIND